MKTAKEPSASIWYPVCHIHMTVQLVTSLMTPAQTHQCPYCLLQPLLGPRRQKATGKKETWLPNRHSQSLGQQVESFWHVEEDRVPFSGHLKTQSCHAYLLPTRTEGLQRSTSPFPVLMNRFSLCCRVLSVKQKGSHGSKLKQGDPDMWQWVCCHFSSERVQKFKLINHPCKETKQCKNAGSFFAL